MRQGGSYLKEKGKDAVLVERTGPAPEPKPEPVKKGDMKLVKDGDKSTGKTSEENPS